MQWLSWTGLNLLVEDIFLDSPFTLAWRSPREDGSNLNARAMLLKKLWVISNQRDKVRWGGKERGKENERPKSYLHMLHIKGGFRAAGADLLPLWPPLLWAHKYNIKVCQRVLAFYIVWIRGSNTMHLTLDCAAINKGRSYFYCHLLLAIGKTPRAGVSYFDPERSFYSRISRPTSRRQITSLHISYRKRLEVILICHWRMSPVDLGNHSTGLQAHHDLDRSQLVRNMV